MSNLIFTNSALRSIHQYDLTKDILYGVVHNYDRKSPGRDPGTMVFHKETGSGYITAIVKNKGNDQLLLACWAKKPQHHYNSLKDKNYEKASFWKRVLMDIMGIFKA